ncbi:hypothetical protein D5R93_05675 [Actinomyces lilanjuaniae]|uniref:Minor tail protein n=1 Tax=Actinomyces lilanjuaniae TaxID=2321394 RepID=A0ABN5PSL5_9ACTO|nr:hypothetical protein [Actinomyces lilanjuaniae]AYD89661.1 hypothetical protein D5R93_05675 [Actinomyces lilanjuaniae]
MVAVRVLDLLDSVPTDPVPRAGADRSATVVGVVSGVSGGGTTVSVSVLGSDPVPLPATASVWTGVQTAYVLMDTATGRPVHVLGPAPAPVGALEAEAPQAEPTVFTTTVTPSWTGTWRDDRGWDQWNLDRYGGRSDLYQGSQGASGPLAGLADYGRAVTSLEAARVTSADLVLVGNGSRAHLDVVVQAAERTSTGPSPTGPTVTATVTGTTPAVADVTPLAEGLLAGTGLALVGSGYGGVSGLGGSMALTLTYEVAR